MKSKVYFMDFRCSAQENLIAKLVRLAETAGLYDTFKSRDIVAIKMHVGDPGNAAVIRSVFVRGIVRALKAQGAFPFLTDTNPLYYEYPGRGDAPNHLHTAAENGFSYSMVEAPMIIADGLRGCSQAVVQIDKKWFKQAYIGAEIANADTLVSMAHFKVHEGAGFGGALKNLAIGCATRGGKLRQHSFEGLQIQKEKCQACGRCIEHCPTGALALVDGVVVKDEEKCQKFTMCSSVCPNSVHKVQWDSAEEHPHFYYEGKMEYAYGVLQGKRGRAFFINFVNNVTPHCDCYQHNDAGIIRDVGVVASQDPVAIDQASVDLMNQEPGLPGTALGTDIEPGVDKIKALYPKLQYEIQLDYAQEIGLGSREYELVKI